VKSAVGIQTGRSHSQRRNDDVVTEDDYIKRMPPSFYKVQKRGGKGVIGASTKEGDTIDRVVTAMNP